MISEEKLLIARCEDLLKRCDKYSEPQFSSFLNENEQAVINKEIGDPIGYNCCFFGGYENAQRTVFGVFPYWQEIDRSVFPISAIKIEKKYKKELSHRDYLGTLLSGGIDRNCIGDILISDDIAYAFTISSMTDYILANTDKISNVGVKSSVVSVFDIIPPEPKFETINTVAASQRLDAIVAAMLKISRKNASMLIDGQKISVNHIITTDSSCKLKENDIISVRGYGRYLFCDIGGETRSQRLHITIKKYI